MLLQNNNKDVLEGMMFSGQGRGGGWSGSPMRSSMNSAAVLAGVRPALNAIGLGDLTTSKKQEEARARDKLRYTQQIMHEGKAHTEQQQKYYRSIIEKFDYHVDHTLQRMNKIKGIT